jgi:hypothetical protein
LTSRTDGKETVFGGGNVWCVEGVSKITPSVGALNKTCFKHSVKSKMAEIGSEISKKVPNY